MKDNIEGLIDSMKCQYKSRTIQQNYQMSLKYCSKCDGYDYECIHYRPYSNDYSIPKHKGEQTE